MRHKIISVFIGIVFLIGLGMVIYPSLSNWLNERNSSRVVAGYHQSVSELKETDYTRYLEAAREYNEKIARAGSLPAAVHMEKEDNLEEYRSVLNVGGDGVMAVIRIPKIKVSLPIYHTAEDAVLQVAVGHYPGSSLPVGGESTHCILTGHRGLPSARLFTDLDQIVEGDIFYLDVLGDTLTYQVDLIQVVLPEKIDSLSVEPGEDYVTLVTCTPYGVNSHRLLIRAKQVPYIPEEEAVKEPSKSEEVSVPTPVEPERRLPNVLIFAVIVFALAILTGTICGSISNRKAKKKGRKEE